MLDNMKVPVKFEVEFIGNMEKITDTLSKCRVRTFYKGFNRNRTYISEEFAQQLIDSLPYAPIKGIYDENEQDYTDHGDDNTEGKIYGVVMAEPNFAWEDHKDKDGVVRSYACADAVVFTGLYPEASEICGKPQSMELYTKKLVGEWRTWQDGRPYYHFISGCLLGLQVLGDDVEPCFEGAAFFKLYQNTQEIIDYIKKIQIKEGEEKVEMSTDKFRLSDNQKSRVIESTLNSGASSECRYWVIDTYSDYALVRDFEDFSLNRVYFTINEDDTVAIGNMVNVTLIDVTKEEAAALEAIKSSLGSYTAAQAYFEEQKASSEEDTTATDGNATEDVSTGEDATTTDTADEVATTEETTIETSMAAEETFALQKRIEELEAQLAEKDSQISEFTEKISQFESEKVELQQKILDITNENDSLLVFKKNIELEKKESILSKYETHLSEAQYSELKNTMSNYSIDDFNKEVCAAVLASNANIFDESEKGQLIPKTVEDTRVLTGAEGLLNKYFK